MLLPRSFYYLFPENKLPDAPKIGQRVRIEGQPGTYLVLRLNTKRFAADLMLTTGKHEIVENVPLFALDPVNEKPSNRTSTVEQDNPAITP